MPTIWIAVLLSAYTCGGAFAVIEMSGGMATLVKGLYAVTVLGFAAYLIMHDGDSKDEFATGAGVSRALDATVKA